jgi:RNA polymerase sigma-70 factor (ECF subfamily)
MRDMDGQTLSNGGNLPHPAAAHVAAVGLPSFDEIYREHASRILNLLNRMVGSEEAAHDLLQDVFLSVYKQLASFRGESSVGTWIHRIAVNLALNHLKREKRRVWRDILDEGVGELLRQDRLDLPDREPSGSERPDELAERSEQEALVARAIAGLPPDLRISLLLFQQEEMSYDEIARTLGISLSAVESRIHRARKRLIRELAPLLRDG